MQVGLSNRLLVALTVVFTAIVFAVYVAGSVKVEWLFSENGIVETATAIAYVTGALICLYGASRAIRSERFYFVLWFALCVLFAGEETSWLQHQLGYSTPEEIARLNSQREFNLHNLKWLHGGDLTGDTAEPISLHTLLTSQNLFRVGFVGYFLLLPMVLRATPLARLNQFLRAPYPDLTLMVCIWVPIAASIIAALAAERVTKSALAETREMLYSTSTLLYCAAMLRCRKQ